MITEKSIGDIWSDKFNVNIKPVFDMIILSFTARCEYLLNVHNQLERIIEKNSYKYTDNYCFALELYHKDLYTVYTLDYNLRNIFHTLNQNIEKFFV